MTRGYVGSFATPQRARQRSLESLCLSLRMTRLSVFRRQAIIVCHEFLNCKLRAVKKSMQRLLVLLAAIYDEGSWLEKSDVLPGLESCVYVAEGGIGKRR